MQPSQPELRRMFTDRPSLRHVAPHGLSVVRSVVRPSKCRRARQLNVSTHSSQCATSTKSSSPPFYTSRREGLAMLLSATATWLLPRPCKASIATLDQAQQVAAAIVEDFVDRQYYVTGNLSKDLYNPNCRFTDPTTDVKGVEPYTKAVALLFDPQSSKAELIIIKVLSPNSIKLRWRLEGALRAGGLKFKPYTGTTIYTLNPDTGLIDSHTETWDIGAVDVFLSTLFPNTGAPPAPPIEVLRAQEADA